MEKDQEETGEVFSSLTYNINVLLNLELLLVEVKLLMNKDLIVNVLR
jgi:hypothetical protein